METNLYCYTRTGCTISEKTMEDGNPSNSQDRSPSSEIFMNCNSERQTKYTPNGHDSGGTSSTLPIEEQNIYRSSGDATLDNKNRKRINPLRIHLGKRPFVENSINNCSANKKRRFFVNKSSEKSALIRNTTPRVPKLIPKQIDRNQFHNVPLQMDRYLDNEQDKPVPRLVPKSQLLQYKKSKIEKSPDMKQYAQNLGLQPMVKYKCRKCCSMSFKSLVMLKEHQRVCQAQAKEPTLSPESTSNTETNNGGPSRVTRKLFLCSSCGSYYENWNLFLHMREVHSGHICLFCLSIFSKAEKLSSHLTHKHDVQEFDYNSKEDFFDVYNGTLYLMCCGCDEVYSEKDDFFNHDCNYVKPKPVPVRISKNSIKTNTVKNANNINKLSTNGSINATKDTTKSISDTRLDYKNELIEIEKNHTELNKLNYKDCKPINSDLSGSSEIVSSQDTSHTIDTGMEFKSLTAKSTENITEFDKNEGQILNGDDSDHSDEDTSKDDSTVAFVTHQDNIQKSEEYVCALPEKDRECGIKLKLSLNNAKSPVIINSTVDPTVGLNTSLKPPSRVRRPPKRYEKDSSIVSPIAPKTPSIKMTICDKANGPFVKTTIYENEAETVLKNLLNNNLECTSKISDKTENSIKTTIYDNKFETMNILNRVPKLTVRVPKELLDKDSSSEYSSDSEMSDKLTMEENTTAVATQNDYMNEPQSNFLPVSEAAQEEGKEKLFQVNKKIEADVDMDSRLDLKIECVDKVNENEVKTEEQVDDTPIIELTLDQPLDKYPLKDLLKVFLTSTVFNCIYCNHARKIAVNCEQLSLHMATEHRFSATVNSITAEELMPETITVKVKSEASELCSVFMNLESYDSEIKCKNIAYNHIFECFQCYFKTAIHKDLCLHNRKMHQKTILLCVMCKNNFYTYSELLCHLCPGTYNPEYEIRFRCCLCNVDTIPSSFRLMVHLRKIHNTCDVCLEFCHNQARLSNHVWKHKLHHLCYRCGIAYRNKPDIANHLFWKHGTESVSCKRCLQKKWPHVYHFCSPPAIFLCEECNLQFTKAVCLKVHKRFHTDEYPHICIETDCSEKFVSKKLLLKHKEEHLKKLVSEDLNTDNKIRVVETKNEGLKEPIIDLIDDQSKKEGVSSIVNSEEVPEKISKKVKKKKLKEKDALLLDVNLPALNLSESDSSDESDGGLVSTTKEEIKDEKSQVKNTTTVDTDSNKSKNVCPFFKEEDKSEQPDDEKPNEQQVLDIWDNFKKYQAKVEMKKDKTPPLVPIRKHVCESDHDYCIVPTDLNGDNDLFSADKKKKKKSPKKKHDGLSSSSSSSSDSDSSCSCGSNCSCSSSSGSSSSSSSDSDSSDESGKSLRKIKQKKLLSNRRISNGSNVDVMGMSETPTLVPEKTEPLIAETDLETEESETDEEFYDKHPQQLANKLYAEKRNQLMLLASVAPSDGGSVSGDASRPATPTASKEELLLEQAIKEKSSSKKKNKKKRKSKTSKKRNTIKIDIPKDIDIRSEMVKTMTPTVSNKITISLQTNTVLIPEAVAKPASAIPVINTPVSSAENKRASKRRRVPNKFYGYSSDEETSQTSIALKPQQPPKLEWRKEDLPSPVTNRTKREVPSTTLTPQVFNYTESIRLTTPIPDPELPRILMNSESMESSDSDSSAEGALEIYQPAIRRESIPPPAYLNSGTSSLPYPFQRPAVREAREGESVYCYCRCPYDEVSEMIACDADGCPIEWFHFECVGIMVPPKGKWYCPECRKNQNLSGYR